MMVMPVARDWLLITVSTPPGGKLDTPRVRVAQSAQPGGSLPAAVGVPAPGDVEDHPRRGAGRDPTARGGRPRRDASHPADGLQAGDRGRSMRSNASGPTSTDEVVGSTRQFHEELQLERRRGRTTYTELEESDADLARYQKWLAAIRARDYFDAPGGHEAAAAVASCEEALARFESEACRRSSTTPRPRAGPDSARSRGITTDSFAEPPTPAAGCPFGGGWFVSRS